MPAHPISYQVAALNYQPGPSRTRKNKSLAPGRIQQQFNKSTIRNKPDLILNYSNHSS
jgi:hypothetical protein